MYVKRLRLRFRGHDFLICHHQIARSNMLCVTGGLAGRQAGGVADRCVAGGGSVCQPDSYVYISNEWKSIVIETHG